MPKAREKVAGVAIAEKLRKLKGQSRSDLVPDHKRGPMSSLGSGSHSRKKKEPGK